MTKFCSYFTTVDIEISRLAIKEQPLKISILKLIALFCVSLSVSPAFAVPAAPTIQTLIQSDGHLFAARQWGDEWNHGWETADGYTILHDEVSQNWVYAIQSSTGELVTSSAVIGQNPHPVGLVPNLRPVSTMMGQHRAKAKMRIAPLQLSILPSGTANILTILINFSDQTTSYSSANFNVLLFGTGTYSMKDYYTEVSYGKFTISAGPGGIAGWYQASKGHDYYGANANGSDQWPGDLVYEAAQAADNANFNFAPYDQDGDCQVDVVNIVHQGSGEEAGGPATDIWSHSWSLDGAYYWGNSNHGAYVTKSPCASGGYIKVNRYVIQPETLWGGMMTMGVFAHEYGHALGLPDLYDTDYSSEGIGDWSLMAGGSWNGVVQSGDRPAHLDAWSKYELGWITPTQVVNGTPVNTTIEPVSIYANTYQLLSGNPTSSSGEYFLVENRQKSGFDAGLPGTGLLVWHIDESVEDNDSECYPSGPSCTSQHYKVALMQADNLWNLEKSSNRGDGGDPYPGTSNNLNLNDSSTPNSRLYSGSASGVSITNITVVGANITAMLSTGGSPTLYKLSVAKTGAGSGTVMSNPSGINCGATCSYQFSSGTNVTLSATPTSGYVFSGWSGACTGTGDCTITMNAEQNVTATFNVAINIATIESSINHYYQSILGRASDTSGLAYWEGEVTRIQGLGIDVQEAFRVLAGVFFTSAEYLAKNTSDNQYITDLYWTFFNHAPDTTGLNYWIGQLTAGLPRSVVLYAFLFSAEFDGYMQSLFGNTTNRAEVSTVVDFYRGFLNRLPDTSGFTYWLGQFRTAQCQGATAVNNAVDAISNQFLTSAEYANRNRSNLDFVADLYYTFLRRGGDLTGFNYWVNQLTNGALTREQERQAFLQSAEFQTRVTQIIMQGCLN